MIFLKISGGLGNQMFQYATALALAKKLNTKVGIDLSSINDKEDKKDFTYRDFQLESLFNLDTYEIVPYYTYSFITGNSITDRVKRKLVGGFYLLEDSLEYQPNIKKCIKN